MQGPYSVLKDGSVALAAAGTRQQLATSTPCAKVIITAGQNNQDVLVIGGVTVVGALNTRSGAVLVPQASITLEIDDLGKIWFDGVVTGDLLTYSYLA